MDFAESRREDPEPSDQEHIRGQGVVCGWGLQGLDGRDLSGLIRRLGQVDEGCAPSRTSLGNRRGASMTRRGGHLLPLGRIARLQLTAPSGVHVVYRAQGFAELLVYAG